MTNQSKIQEIYDKYQILREIILDNPDIGDTIEKLDELWKVILKP